MTVEEHLEQVQNLRSQRNELQNQRSNAVYYLTQRGIDDEITLCTETIKECKTEEAKKEWEERLAAANRVKQQYEDQIADIDKQIADIDKQIKALDLELASSATKTETKTSSEVPISSSTSTSTTDNSTKETIPAKTTDSSTKESKSTEQDSKTTSSESTDPRSKMTDKEKQDNAKMAQMYPERSVDGVYYADDKALAAAKAAQEKRVQGESKQAEAEAIAKAQKLAAAMKTINETLYGTDNSEVITQLQGSVGGAELSSILGNAVSIRARQHLLDFTKFKEDFKAANSGKPPHNRDPFPVDQKIEEFETHQPRVKVHDIITHNHGKAAAIMGIMQFDAAEKRIVRLENNMATLMRYLYRLGSRVFINCQYYGGQTTFEKEHSYSSKVKRYRRLWSINAELSGKAVKIFYDIR